MAGEKQQKVSLWSIFLVFLKIGAFTIGGGYAIFPVIRSEVIKRGWVSEEDFPDILALSQTAPGLIAVNMAIFTGYRIRGTKGGVVAALGGILPPFLIILIVAMAFAQFKDNPVIIRIFKGIRPVVVALIAAPMIKMSIETNKTRWWSWLITAASLCLVAFLKISPIYILLTTIVIALAVVIGRDRAMRMKNMRDYIKTRKERTEEAAEAEKTEKPEKKFEGICQNEGNADEGGDDDKKEEGGK